ncbi:MAG TPA: SGNH/GDSL hydrolase family protein [Candidatus Saccharimonadales bacterium]|jgi:lysophospholipase L1-like esterase
MKHRLLVSLAIFITALVLLAIVQFLLIKYNGTPVPVPNIPRGPETYGNGPALTYVVLGDSTAVGQGGDYDKAIARGTARHLASNRQVTLHNFAISGARSADVLRSQLPEALKLRPDVVLLDIAANDVTHLTPVNKVVANIQDTVAALQSSNPAVRIVVTGAPQMGSVPRLPQPLRYAAKLRTNDINQALAKTIPAGRVVLAPLAAKTGPIFANNHKLFAADKFHPNTAGYQVWIPVLNDSLDEVMAKN